MGGRKGWRSQEIPGYGGKKEMEIPGYGGKKEMEIPGDPRIWGQESHKDSVRNSSLQGTLSVVVWFSVFLLRLTARLGLPCPGSLCPSSSHLLCNGSLGVHPPSPVRQHFNYGECVCWRLGKQTFAQLRTGFRLNIEAGSFPAVSALAARCSTQLTYTDTSLHPHKHLFARKKKCL